LGRLRDRLWEELSCEPEVEPERAARIDSNPSNDLSENCCQPGVSVKELTSSWLSTSAGIGTPKGLVFSVASGAAAPRRELVRRSGRREDVGLGVSFSTSSRRIAASRIAGTAGTGLMVTSAFAVGVAGRTRRIRSFGIGVGALDSGSGLVSGLGLDFGLDLGLGSGSGSGELCQDSDGVASLVLVGGLGDGIMGRIRRELRLEGAAEEDGFDDA